MRILQVSSVDSHAGGAEGVAWQLFQAYRRAGHQSWLAVGDKRSDDADVWVIPNDQQRTRWARACRIGGRLLKSRVRPGSRAGRFLRTVEMGVGQPHRWWQVRLGYEDFNFPGTWRLLALAGQRPDVIHCHNLHGAWLPGRGYFDLRALPWLSQQVPLLLTLHDAWLVSGHCAHSFGCDRWMIGCGACPDLTIYPSIPRDATAHNWRRKHQMYARSRLYVATPSQWLMRKVTQSMLMQGVVEARVIPYGVDRTVFHPGSQPQARQALGLPQEARICLFAANTIRRNPWKDYQTLHAALQLVAADARETRIVCVALGEQGTPERVKAVEIQFVPYQTDRHVMARYYQAADVYVHAAKVDTFPNTVLEALACGVPVVATAVGGIPEQVKGLAWPGAGPGLERINRWDQSEATGILVPPGDAEAMAAALWRVLHDETLRVQLGRHAAEDARRRFDLDDQVARYLAWYAELREHHGRDP